MSPIATVVHISDLHLIREITERGRMLFAKTIGVKTHSYAKVQALSGAFASFPEQGVVPDVLLVTGDVCTNGSEEALRTGLDFIERESFTPYGPARRRGIRGLGVASHQRVILPGNHDRYSADSWLPVMDRDNINLENVFSEAATGNTWDGYPYSRGYRRPEQRRSAQARTLLFFIFDSTAMTHDPEDSVLTTTALWRSPIYGAARGRLTPEECEFPLDQSQVIKQNNEIMGLDGKAMPVEYGATIRIAVLHHHPVNTSHGADPLDPKKLMERHDVFVKNCLKAEVDLVLFGHQHERFECEIRGENGHCTRFFCCPSTAEYSETDAGFYLFSFYQDSFTMTPFTWKKEQKPSGASAFERGVTSPPYEYSRQNH